MIKIEKKLVKTDDVIFEYKRLVTPFFYIRLKTVKYRFFERRVSFYGISGIHKGWKNDKGEYIADGRLIGIEKEFKSDFEIELLKADAKKEAKKAESTAIPWGRWNLATGRWHPNEGLMMSKEDQHASNVKSGYSCDCGFIKSKCVVCRDLDDEEI